MKRDAERDLSLVSSITYMVKDGDVDEEAHNEIVKALSYWTNRAEHLERKIRQFEEFLFREHYILQNEVDLYWDKAIKEGD